MTLLCCPLIGAMPGTSCAGLSEALILRRRKRRLFRADRLALCLVVYLLGGSFSPAADWPRLGGPEGAGVSPETGLAREWPAGGPPEIWSVEVGDGFAGPAVRAGQVFLLDRTNAQDILRCFELASGHELWRFAYDAAGALPYNGSRNVPTVAERYAYALGPFGDFHAIDLLTHRSAWARHLVNDFKDPAVDRESPPASRQEKLARAQVPMWGLTQAPLLYKDLVIVAPQTEATGLVAYEQATGNLRWRSAYVGRNWYSHVSPSLATLGGVKQIIMLAQPSDPEKSPDQAPPAIISAIEPDTGRLLWKTQTPQPYKVPIPQPVQVAEDRLFITGGLRMECVMLRVTCHAGQWEAQALFHNREVAAHIHSPVFYRDRIYVTSFKEDGGRHVGLVCLNANGEVLWETGPDLQFESGGYVIADGLAYVLHGKTGELNLIELGDTGPKLLAHARVLDAKGANAWAPLALSHGKLLVRDQHQMKCLDVGLNSTAPPRSR